MSLNVLLRTRNDTCINGFELIQSLGHGEDHDTQCQDKATQDG